MKEASLFLIPVTLGDTAIDKVLPANNREIIGSIKHFIVEDIRSARRFLKKSNPDIVIDDLTFYTLNEHTKGEDIGAYLNAINEGLNVGVISEAGCPAIADPGADVVAIAQSRNIKVIFDDMLYGFVLFFAWQAGNSPGVALCKVKSQ